MFGASENLAPVKGMWQFNFNYRGLTSDDHYNGIQFQYQRETAGNYVINTQQLYDFGLSYNFTEHFALFASVPIVNASWSLPTPPQAPIGPRREQNASGLGDISAMGRWWMLDFKKHPTANLSLGIGVKAPTGDYAAEDEYPNINGSNDVAKAVDQSIQPGDGGWGILFDLQTYKALEHTTFFFSGTYLANPRDTNGTPSIIVGLGFGANPAFADLVENSVPDQYMARTGAAFPVAKDLMALSIGFRIEGMPRYDLFGESHGWRRPGYETYLEPGIVFNHGRNSWTIYVPRAIMRNRRPNPYTGNPGDATFPDYVVLLGYSYSFGAGLPLSNPIPDLPEPTSPHPPGGGTSSDAEQLPACGSAGS